MESPGHCSLLSHPQHSAEHSNRSSPHPATDLHPQLHPESNESGTERWREVGTRRGGGGGGGVRTGRRERGGEETGMVWQMCIQIYHASFGSEWSQREQRERERVESEAH